MKIYRLPFFTIPAILLLFCGCGRVCENPDYAFTLAGATPEGYQAVTEQTVYGEAGRTYGYDLGMAQNGTGPFFFSAGLPEGNYLVTVVLGGKEASVTTVKSESRRLMLENIATAAGEQSEQTFTVNIRNKYYGQNDSVRINTREIGKLIWDDKLTLEFNGVNPLVSQIRIDSANYLPTIFLAGNSTVVDEANEPWCGWGQIFPRFMSTGVVVANYAESGLAANSFVSSRRFAKLLTRMKAGDYLFIEFGHNDQKQKGEDKGPYTSYKSSLKYLVDKTREKGGTPILITPVHRRRFDENGRVVNTHGEYPDAVRQLAAEEKVYLIDLNTMSETLYEAWGTEASKRAFVHYPAGTFPGQNDSLADNTHFNTYGGYQITRCIVQGIRDNDIPLKTYIREEINTFDPAKPDDPDKFNIPATPFFSIIKPLGN